ncbi:MAG TPA: hypothetical protein VFV86_13275, partial [Nitrososphaeraceae archaeon]|nr:hypothetical protein [Nitrososphaeraceae archaeon]
MVSDGKKNIGDLTLEELFPKTLSDTPCVYIDKEKEVSIAIEMCAQYIESTIDSIVVKDELDKPIGIVGGYDLLDFIRQNPTRELQYLTKIKKIMFETIPQFEEDTKLKHLIEFWERSRRAYAVILGTNGTYSSFSARKILEIGKKMHTNFHMSSFSKKPIVTFKIDDSIGKILDLMFKNNTRKLILENTNLFICDRLILAEISRILKFQQNFEYFLDLSIKNFRLEYIWKAQEDLNIKQIC